MGVLFLIQLCVALYFFVADPYNLKPLIFGETSPKTLENTPSTESVHTGTGTPPTTGFTLSAAQKSALTSLGIDPTTVPSTISAAQEVCFVETLGSARVSEIKAGAVPNAIELLKAKPCIK